MIYQMSIHQFATRLILKFFEFTALKKFLKIQVSLNFSMKKRTKETEESECFYVFMYIVWYVTEQEVASLG